ncbi:hypothetical protein DSM02_1973 [Leeuwenhoekiella polynyae]|uniref:Uncharacterized protein n=1 Tax=Leeuwenhoekiella polynyae TaxID=1550906 RepID=A0A4Q0P691_9FLAO|nr:hypothetical protein DSM02_1973 [Leeuwenhoekiella polynyae]
MVFFFELRFSSITPSNKYSTTEVIFGVMNELITKRGMISVKLI